MEGSWHPKGWMEGGWGQPLLRKMHGASKKQAALAGSVRWEDMQDGGYRQPGPFPAWRLGWLSSPLERSSPKFGERSKLDWGSVTWDVSESAREMEKPSWGPRRLHAFQSPPAHMQRQQAGSPKFTSFLHSKQTRHERTKRRLKWSPLLFSRGARGGQRPQSSPDLTPLHTRSHTLKQRHAVLPWAQAKAKPQPRLKKQPLENDACPSASWTCPPNPPRRTAAGEPTAFSQSTRLLIEREGWEAESLSSGNENQSEANGSSSEFGGSPARPQASAPSAPAAWLGLPDHGNGAQFRHPEEGTGSGASAGQWTEPWHSNPN